MNEERIVITENLRYIT